MKVHSLCALIAGNGATVWNRDIDRLVPEWLLYGVEKLAGVPASVAKNAGLGRLAEVLNGGTPNKLGNEPWILPLGIWHRKRLRFGVQFCPLCFHSASGQYVRRAWRLAFYTECELHHVLMRDRCQACAAPLTYFRAELGDRSRVDVESMAKCTQCGASLYGATSERFEWPGLELTQAIRTLLFMKDFGWATLEGRIFEPASDLFRVLRQLVAIMSSPKVDGQLYDAVADQIWPEGYHCLGSRGLSFEFRGVLERHRLFGMAVWLLMDWPRRFRSTFRAAGIGRHCLVQGRKTFPVWWRAEYEHLLGGASL